jgi:hypothetical protein
MANDWQTLTRLTGGSAIRIERVRILESDIAIEGSFDPPALAQLSAEDQIFISAFVRCHGSIKQMEKFFGVSYPTIKNRLNRVGSLLPFVEVAPQERAAQASASELITRLERGEISVKDVLAQLRASSRRSDERRHQTDSRSPRSRAHHG